MIDHVRNGNVSNYCTRKEGGNALVFGNYINQNVPYQAISSRSLLTSNFSSYGIFSDTTNTLLECSQPSSPSTTDDMNSILSELTVEQQTKSKV